MHFLGKNIGGVSTFVLAIGSFCWTMFYGKRGQKYIANDEDKEEACEEKEEEDIK